MHDHPEKVPLNVQTHDQTCILCDKITKGVYYVFDAVDGFRAYACVLCFGGNLVMTEEP